MRPFVILFLTQLLFFSCKNRSAPAASVISTDTAAANQKKQVFFPVTNYIKGQINDIKSGGVNPLKFTTVNNTTDSSWLKMENLDKELAPFLEPQIDTQNLAGLFTENRFLDQTLNTFTFSADPTGVLPENFPLQHWDVYVDPQNEQVTRVYMVKKAGSKTMQLTWQSNKWAKIVSLGQNEKGQPAVEKEILIKWDL